MGQSEAWVSSPKEVCKGTISEKGKSICCRDYGTLRIEDAEEGGLLRRQSSRRAILLVFWKMFYLYILICNSCYFLIGTCVY